MGGAARPGPAAPQPALVGTNGRRFAGFAAAVLVFIVDPGTRRFLLLSSPSKRARPGWEVVNGGMEAGETVLEAVLRESAEEAGPSVALQPLGTVHAWTWRYDDAVTHMLSIAFVCAYLGGEVVPGDDMAASEVRWASLDEVRSIASAGDGLIPSDVWIFERALESFDRWWGAEVPWQGPSGS